VSADRWQARAWLVDKPAGPTSHDAVRDVRRRLSRGTKVGHAGTLDPFATGLLVILVGRATRLADRVSAQSKGYRATIRLGTRSETGDIEGPLTTGGPVPGIDAIQDALEELCTWTSQRVPAYSAVRIDGERLYHRARRGEAIATLERSMLVHEIELIAYDAAAAELSIDLHVSKGTYVRQIAMDLGELLGCGAYCQTLRRTTVGHLEIADAVALDQVPYVAPVPLTSLLADMPTQAVGPEDARALVHGRATTTQLADGEVAVTADDGTLLAIALSIGGLLRPKSVFVGPEYR
jgi:tRNA pseudouridine55 synthase